MLDEHSLRAAALAFPLPSETVTLQPLGAGLIHDTFRLDCADGSRFVLQRFNDAVFPDPAAVMENIGRVCAHLQARGGQVPELIATRDGAPVARDAAGRWWRLYRYVPASEAHRAPADTAMAFRGGQAFGAFAAALQGLPGPRLHETIPGFHDTPARMAALERAAAQDPLGRAAGAAQALAAIRARAPLVERWQADLAGGGLPERVVHNDTKFNNLLFHRDSGELLAVVDLDTVMPGRLVQDFGDLVRSAARRDGAFDLALYRALLDGYLAATGALLTPVEREWLPLAPRLLALELASRFLCDHLLGDGYFRVQEPGENLRRCARQLELLEQMEASGAAMQTTLTESSKDA